MLELPKYAVLCAVHLPETNELEFRESLAELARLATTLGLSPMGEITQRRSSFDSAAYIGPGKLADLVAMTQTAPEQTVILIDHEISPSQARHIQEATNVKAVLDRTAVILEIFHRHAQTRQAKIQVEMVRLAYMAPRLRETDLPHDRQRGIIGGKGAGESAMELDRRKIRDRLAELRDELREIERERVVQRNRRQNLRRVALCGYTNAGKSTLFRELTSSDAYIADKLFATLDTTVRVLQPEVQPKILASDTIGFIRNLPTKLVASFKSTLDEAREAGLLLHVVDISDPAWERHIETTNQVLAEIEAGEIPQLLVFNKIDRLENHNLPTDLLVRYPNALRISAFVPKDIQRVHQAIVAFFDERLVSMELLVPYSHSESRGLIYAHSHVIEEQFLDQGTLYRLRVEPEWVHRLQEFAHPAI